MSKKFIFVIIIGFIVFAIFAISFQSLQTSTPVSGVSNEISKNVEIEETDPELIVPVKLYIIDSISPYASKRDKQEVRRIMENVNEIWGKANIRVEIESLEFLVVSEESAFQASKGNNSLLLSETPTTDTSALKGFFIGKLFANGVAFTNQASFIVGDVTSVNDFRATSHEIGHLLGLKHNDASSSFLMAQGKNGTILLDSEIETSRAQAERFFEQETLP